MDRKKAEDLIKKYQAGSCSPEEKARLEQWYSQRIDDQHESFLPEELDEIGAKIFKRLPVKRKNRKQTFYRSVAAILVLATVSFVIDAFFLKETNSVVSRKGPVHSITPGGNKAYLTLEDGTRLALDEVEEGHILEQRNISVSKTTEGQLVYALPEEEESIPERITYNTISIPRGGQYQIRLPDGTRVWLNAESTLTYPTTFAGSAQRKVQLKGEAYFEVAHRAQKPFLIHVASLDSSLSQDIEVLGTRFNVNGYADQGALTTTLIEGSVKVRSAGKFAVLKPNQQSQVKQNAFSIEKVNPEAAIAWKNGYFMFENEPVESIMQKIARWYNVEVVFQDTDQTQVFSGTVSRFEDVQAVLHLLELTGGVEFRIEANKIIVD